MAAVGGDNDIVTDVCMVQLNTVASTTAAGKFTGGTIYQIYPVPNKAFFNESNTRS